MKVIVAIDQTDNWKQIVDYVVSRTWPVDTIFRVLTVVESTDRSVNNTGASKSLTADRILHQARAQLLKYLPACTIYTEVRKGNAAEELVTIAANWMVDKIILGCHGSSSNRLIPGTISQSVATHSCCSIDLVKLKAATAIGEKSSVA